MRRARYPIGLVHERVRNILLERWGRLVTDRPLLTLLACLALAGAGAALALTNLEMKTERSDLVAGDLDWNRRYAEYKANYPRWDDVLVCFEAPEARDAVDDLARRIARRLRQDARVEAAESGFDPSAAPRLFQTAPLPELNTTLERIRLIRAVGEAPNVNSALATILQKRSGEPEADDRPAAPQPLLEPFLEAVRGETAEFGLPGFDGAWQPHTTESGRIRFISVQFTGDDQSASGVGDAVAWLRDVVGRMVADSDIPDVPWGVTGIPVIEADETDQSMTDSMRASIVALALITIMMAIVFRGLAVPLIAALALLIGLGWSFGWVVLAVGHLQLLSIVFAIVLLGLGVDFALHIVSRLELIRHESDSLGPLIVRVFRGTGPGLLTGALTTAVAFVTIAFSDFRGAAEMGVISAGGILLCLVAVMTSFPAMLALTGRHWKKLVHPRGGGEGEEAHFLEDHLRFIYTHPLPTVILSCLIIAVAGWLAVQVRYDPNVLNLHPPGIESVEWERRLIEDSERSAWAALVVADPEVAPALVRRLEALPEVSSVDGMGAFIPTDADERRRRVEAIAQEAIPPLTVGPGPGPLRLILTQLASGLREATPEDGAILALAERIEEALEAADDVSPDVAQTSWEVLNQSFLDRRERYAQFAAEALTIGDVQAEDLPDTLKARLIGADGSWLLRVNPVSTDKSVLAPERLGPFVEAVRSVAPGALGPPVQIYESSLLIQRAYVQAALFALPAILILLILDFRSLWDALGAMLPVVLGFVGVFALMALFNVPLNFANMIVMPVILGIGVDAGVHVVHRWRDDPNGRPPGLSGGTGRGITLTTVTTVIGFGSMMIAHHRGIQSLGFVMVVGLLTVLLACYTVLPAILTLRHKGKNGAAPARE